MYIISIIPNNKVMGSPEKKNTASDDQCLKIEAVADTNADVSVASTNILAGITTELHELLETQRIRLQRGNLCLPPGVTFENVQLVLNSNVEIAQSVYAAEKYLGAEMHFVQSVGGKNRFTDLRQEPNIKQQIVFLNSIAQVGSEFYDRRIEVIQELRAKYPRMELGAFDREPEDKSGPNAWEVLLIEQLLKLKSLLLDDYLLIQDSLPQEEWLDLESSSWVFFYNENEEDRDFELKGAGVAGAARRSSRGEVVSGDWRAMYRDPTLGVRLRTKDLAVS